MIKIFIKTVLSIAGFIAIVFIAALIGVGKWIEIDSERQSKKAYGGYD